MPETETLTLPLLPLTPGVILPQMVVTLAIESPEARDAAEGALATDRRGLLVPRAGRSEEHTSELQSHHKLVCRLLLQKKKYQGQGARVRPDPPVREAQVPLAHLLHHVQELEFFFFIDRAPPETSPFPRHGPLLI